MLDSGRKAAASQNSIDHALGWRRSWYWHIDRVDNLQQFPHRTEHGFVVEPGNLEMLADSIALLSTDLALRERFARNASLAARHWTPHLFASNLIDLSHSILSDTKRPPDPEVGIDYGR